ncbi:MAG: hypothetical protein J6N49_04350 [Alphaproteobacteria bacterium]|nr:hypothetical protein [Alphaproteobacteria bacterium]
MFKQIFLIVWAVLLSNNVQAQYVDLSGTNSFIQKYVEESPENWNKSVLFVFYDGNNYCGSCPKAIEMIYDLYAREFITVLNIFEIDYSERSEFTMQLDYNLTQPLSLVVVRINDGLSQGYYKIDNPQDWIDNPSYFNAKITNSINDFLLQ